MVLSVLTALRLWWCRCRTTTITRSTQRSRSAHWRSWCLPLRYNKFWWRLWCELGRNHISRCLSRERRSINWSRTCHLNRIRTRWQIVSWWYGRWWSSTWNRCLRLNARWKLWQICFRFIGKRWTRLHRAWWDLLRRRWHSCLWLNSSHGYSWFLWWNYYILRLRFRLSVWCGALFRRWRARR